jgi:hypothetical protein
MNSKIRPEAERLARNLWDVFTFIYSCDNKFKFRLCNYTDFKYSSISIRLVLCLVLSNIFRLASSYSFLTSALDRGKRSALCPGSAFPPDKGPTIPNVQKGGWASEPVWTEEVRGKILCPWRGSNPDRPVVQSVVRNYTDWASPAPASWYTPI